MSNKKKAKEANYMAKVVAQTENGIIDYDPDSLNEVVGGDKLSYDEYIQIQRDSAPYVRGAFQLCYYECALGFMGQIEKRTKEKICFKRIFVQGMYRDGECFDGKEDHVWMDLDGFEEYQEGDSISFFADVYRYLKTGNGKRIDFGLMNPKDIKRIPGYELPSDDELIRQELEMLVCETCFLHDQCFGDVCLLPKGKRKAQVDAMHTALKASDQKQ